MENYQFNELIDLLRRILRILEDMENKINYIHTNILERE